MACALAVDLRVLRGGDIPRGGRKSKRKGAGVGSRRSMATPTPKEHVMLGELLLDAPAVAPSEEFKKHALTSSFDQYFALYKRSIRDPAGFWADIASQFYWKVKWGSEVCSQNFDVRSGRIEIEWFKGGVTNICYNAVDRHVEAGEANKVAIYWEGNDPGCDGCLTYKELLMMVCQLSNYLKDIGVKKGDAVAIYLPMLPELPIAMLACARIGAIHSVVFAGYSAESLAQRIIDCKPKAVLTCNVVRRGAKVINLKEIVDAALEESSKYGVSVGICLTYANESVLSKQKTPWKEGRDIWWQDEVKNCSTTCQVEWVDAEDPLFLLYTSGSTGKPKGVLHTTGGYMVYSATTFKYAFDYKPRDIYWCSADCGWITGHSYVTYGPLLNGATVVIFEGVPNYPDSGRCWEIVDKYKVTIFYTAPTLVRSLMRSGDEYVRRHSRKSLRILGSVGEPINPTAWRWFYNVVGDGRCPISDTWWQTETGGFMITPLPGAWPQKPGSATLPFFGVEPAVVDENGVEIIGECSGYLCVKGSWPGCFRTLYGDHERYETTYFKPFKGYYFSGDGCSRDKDGYYWLTGRVDDVINVSGHRIGTAEVESALGSHPLCAEAAVVGIEHELKGQSIYAFVTLVEGVQYSEEVRKSLKLAVRNQVITDAAPVCQRAGKLIESTFRHIFWTPCCVHALNNALKDIGKIAWVKNVVSEARELQMFICNRHISLALFRSFSKKEFIKPAETRYATYFLLLERMLEVQDALQGMVVTQEWKKWPDSQTIEGKAHRDRVLDENWWGEIRYIVSFLAPIVDVIRYADTDSPNLGEIYETFDSMLETMKKTISARDPSFYESHIGPIILKRWNKMNTPIHMAAHALNPKWYTPREGKHTPNDDIEVKDGFRKFVNKLYTSEESAIIRAEFMKFVRLRGPRFSTPECRDDRDGMAQTDPIGWWDMYGGDTPHLITLAIRLLSQVGSSSAAERNWSTYGFIHSLRRNRLTPRRAEKLVAVHSSLRLFERVKPEYRASPVARWDVDPVEAASLEVDDDVERLVGLSMEELELDDEGSSSDSDYFAEHRDDDIESIGTEPFSP